MTPYSNNRGSSESAAVTTVDMNSANNDTINFVVVVVIGRRRFHFVLFVVILCRFIVQKYLKTFLTATFPSLNRTKLLLLVFPNDFEEIHERKIRP